MDILDGVEGLELSEQQKAKIEENLNSQYVSSEEFGKVKSNRDELLTEKKTAQQKQQEAEAAAEQARHEAAAKKGDVEGLKSSYEKQIGDLKETVSSLQNKEKRRAIGDIASDFVGKNVVDDAFIRKSMKDAFSKRLDVRDGETVVLDAEGNLTGLKLEDLQSEFLQNSEYKAHIVGSDANGGGAGGGNKGEAGGNAPKSLKDAKTPEERRAVLRERMSGVK